MIPFLAACLMLAPGEPVAPRVDSIIAAAWSAADQAQDKEEIQHQKDIQSDKDLGKKYSAEADKELKMSTDKVMLARLQKIGAEMAAVANKTHVVALWGDKRFNQFDYTFHLVDDKDVNAFSLPGGYIYVNTGLMNYVETDDELAGVLAHEITHAALRHVATLQREMEKLNAVTLPVILIAILTGAGSDVLPAGQLFSVAKGNGWSVQAEQAADFGGFQYMLKSQYDPTAMLTVMERLAKDERSQPSIDYGIFRTHPPGRERAEALIKEMKDAGVPMRRSRVSTSLRATTKALDAGQVEILFGPKHIVTIAGADAAARGTEIANRLNNFFDATPELYDIELGPQNSILGMRQTLLTVSQQDADSQKLTIQQLEDEAYKNLRTALYNMAYRIWDVK